MCDTLAIVEPNRVLFAKNSDRDPNEAQFIEHVPRQDYAKGERLQCTWITIPQAPRTCAVVISRPFWMWGAEMGANEHGVVIGNEAVFTKAPYAKTGLTGMDLLRLALERAETAERACDTITQLLEEHGQGGGCGYENKKFTYHNSFIVADPARAFVLETAGREWAIEEINGARTISNGLTIPGFAEKHSDFLYTRLSACTTRRARTQELAARATGAGDLFRLLRDHGEGHNAPHYSWANGGLAAPCVHAGGLLASSQTTASWVSDLRPGHAQHWATGTAAPCTGLFKPLSFDRSDQSDQSDGLWRRHERLHRLVAQNPAELLPLFATERDATEAQWLMHPPNPQAAWQEGGRLLEKWLRIVQNHPARDTRPFWVRRYWAKRAYPSTPSIAAKRKSQ